MKLALVGGGKLFMVVLGDIAVTQSYTEETRSFTKQYKPDLKMFIGPIANSQKLIFKVSELKTFCHVSPVQKLYRFNGSFDVSIVEDYFICKIRIAGSIFFQVIKVFIVKVHA